EYHADACAIAIAGSEGLESMLIRLREQEVIERLAYGALNQIWQKRHQMPDSVPDFLVEIEKRCQEGFHEQARQTLINETPGWLSTHPTACQRIREARRRSEPGLFLLEKSARALFNDFSSVAAFVSARHYYENLHLAVTPAMIRPAHAFFEGSTNRAAATQS